MMNTRIQPLVLIAFVLILTLNAGVAQAQVSFGTPANLGPMVNSEGQEGSPNISADGLELYFNSNRDGGEGGNDIWVSKRATTDDEWGEAVNLGPIVNSAANEVAPSISADGLAIYFCDWGNPRPGGLGETDLWVTTRPTKDGAWGTPVNLGPAVNSSAHEVTPEISFDGLELYFDSDRPGGADSHDLWVSTRTTTNGNWGKSVNLGSTVNGPVWEHCPTISSDGLMLFFDLEVPGGQGHAANDLMVTMRAARDADWGKPVNLGHAASGHYASDVSTDGMTLYIASDYPGGSGGNDIWQIPILSR